MSDRADLTHPRACDIEMCADSPEGEGKLLESGGARNRKSGFAWACLRLGPVSVVSANPFFSNLFMTLIASQTSHRHPTNQDPAERNGPIFASYQMNFNSKCANAIVGCKIL